MPFRRVWNGTESVPQQNPAAEVVTVLETMREFRHSEPGLVMYPYGGSGTRVPLRSDTKKVVFRFFARFYCIWWNSLSSRVVNRTRKTREKRVLTLLLWAQNTRTMGYATPMEQQWRAPMRYSVEQFIPGFSPLRYCPALDATLRSAKTVDLDIYS